MYYGTINGMGELLTEFANSNNFTASSDEHNKKTIKITFDQWTKYRPTITSSVTPAPLPFGFAMSLNSDTNKWEATLTFTANADSVEALCFRASTGMRRSFSAGTGDPLYTFNLIPEIITFDQEKMLVLKTDSLTVQPLGNPAPPAENLYLDKGTVLIGVGTQMRLELSTLVVEDPDDESNKWNLSAWTYGGGSGANGRQWTTDGDTQYWDLSIDLATNGPATTPYTFAVMGTPDRDNSPATDVYLSTDPIVRLTAVAPGGLASTGVPDSGDL